MMVIRLVANVYKNKLVTTRLCLLYIVLATANKYWTQPYTTGMVINVI